MSKSAKKEEPPRRIGYREALMSIRLTSVLAAYGYKMPWCVANSIVGNIGLQSAEIDLENLELLEELVGMPNSRAFLEEILGSGAHKLSSEERIQLVEGLTMGEEND